MFELVPTPISACIEILPKIFNDERGSFFKVFHEDFFASQKIGMQPREMFYSWSEPNVIRGMHFQNPPHDHAKLVTCLQGEVLDVAVDLRVDSPTYGRSLSVKLTDQRKNLLYIPSGFAHGFCVLGDKPALMSYVVTSVHSAKEDSGIRWDSFGFSWPVANPIVSERDRQFSSLTDFRSPFRWRANS